MFETLECLRSELRHRAFQRAKKEFATTIGRCLDVENEISIGVEQCSKTKEKTSGTVGFQLHVDEISVAIVEIIREFLIVASIGVDAVVENDIGQGNLCILVARREIDQELRQDRTALFDHALLAQIIREEIGERSKDEHRVHGLTQLKTRQKLTEEFIRFAFSRQEMFANVIVQNNQTENVEDGEDLI